MSQIISILKNKNRVERRNKQRRMEELQELKLDAAFRSRLHEDMKVLDVIFGDESVEKVIVEVPKSHISRFQKAIYTEEMAQYSVKQIDESHYAISRKMVNF